MPPDRLHPDEVDARLGWPAGQAQKLARKKKLPHYKLPDGSLMFSWQEVAALIEHVPACGDAGKAVTSAR